MCETGYMCKHFDTDKLKKKSHRISGYLRKMSQ